VLTNLFETSDGEKVGQKLPSPWSGIRKAALAHLVSHGDQSNAASAQRWGIPTRLHYGNGLLPMCPFSRVGISQQFASLAIGIFRKSLEKCWDPVGMKYPGIPDKLRVRIHASAHSVSQNSPGTATQSNQSIQAPKGTIQRTPF
jgi:hypothetical protein